MPDKVKKEQERRKDRLEKEKKKIKLKKEKDQKIDGDGGLEEVEKWESEKLLS